MGGSINIAARFNDGQAICVDGWTNFMPRMVLNQTTLSGDDAVVRETLMEAARSDHYAGPQAFCASGYGMVAIDFVTKTIHSKQGYTGFGDRRILANFVDLQASGWTGEDNAKIKAMEDFFSHGTMEGFAVKLTEEGRSLLQGGRLNIVEVSGKDVDPYLLDEAKLIELVKRDTGLFLKNEEREMPMVEVDLNPFTVIDYPEDAPLTPMKERLRADGFPLTKEEGLNAIFSSDKDAAA